MSKNKTHVLCLEITKLETLYGKVPSLPIYLAWADSTTLQPSNMHTSTTVSSEQNTHAKTRFESRQTDASSTPKQQAGLNHPLEAALGVKSSYVAKLHESLIKFLDDLAEKSIRLFSDYFYKDVKYQANFSDPAYLPKAIKQIGLVTLQTKGNVTECKNYKNLQTKLSADLEATRQRITSEYLI